MLPLESGVLSIQKDQPLYQGYKTTKNCQNINIKQQRIYVIPIADNTLHANLVFICTRDSSCIISVMISCSLFCSAQTYRSGNADLQSSLNKIAVQMNEGGLKKFIVHMWGIIIIKKI